MFNVVFNSAPLLFLTQSFWRDEAYSVLIAQKPIATYFNLSFEPPLYYTLLHLWIKLFGTSEIAVRSLSLLAFLIATYFVGKLAQKMYGTSWLSALVPIVFFLNPMLFYYAFEARAYGWYMAFTIISIYYYFEKKWPIYILATILGLYTHAYMAFVIFAQILHYVVTHRTKHIQIKKILSDTFFHSILTVGIWYIPWLTKMYIDIPKLTQSWYFPVDTQLFKSVLGNIFLGYEGTPWNLWIFMEKVSYVLLPLSILAIARKQNRTYTVYFFLLLYIPLITILSISLYKPLFVMRYMIPATIAEIFLITAAIGHIKNHTVQKILGTLLCIFLISFSLWYAPYHKKIDIKNTVRQINLLQRKNDVIFVDDALILYETMYYNKSDSQIYWYNPKEYAFPWYIGDYIVEKKQIVYEIPPYPIRAFLIHLDGSYDVIYNVPISNKPVQSVNTIKK